MKNIKITCLFLMTLLLASCEKELDINTDPNAPTTINAGLALSAAQGSLVTVLGGAFSNLGGFYAQYHTQAPSASQYEAIDQYNINSAFADNEWDELYSGCLNDLKYVIDESNKSGETGTTLIGILTRAYTFQLLVDTFGDVPYTESLQGIKNITPKVDEGSFIYNGLINEINDAVAKYESNPVKSTVGKQDAIFGGDMDLWIQFANTLKLKMYLRMAYTNLANPAAVNELLSKNNFLNQDAKFAIFGKEIAQRNPFYEVQIIRLGDVNNVASNSLFNFYDLNSDPRLEKVFRANAANAYAAIEQGSFKQFPTTLASNYSRPNIIEDTPVYLFSKAESKFLQAEALVRYQGGAGAKTVYEEGIQASFETYGLNPTDANVLFTSSGPYTFNESGNLEEKVRQIIIQKWAALPYINNMEAYIESTRTKYPEIATGTVDYSKGNRIISKESTLGGTTIPSILFYPDNELERNTNIKQHDNLAVNVWWDKK
jgi:Starch-binding associating with outer membrane